MKLAVAKKLFEGKNIRVREIEDTDLFYKVEEVLEVKYNLIFFLDKYKVQKGISVKDIKEVF